MTEREKTIADKKKEQIENNKFAGLAVAGSGREQEEKEEPKQEEKQEERRGRKKKRDIKSLNNPYLESILDVPEKEKNVNKGWYLPEKVVERFSKTAKELGKQESKLIANMMTKFCDEYDEAIKALEEEGE